MDQIATVPDTPAPAPAPSGGARLHLEIAGISCAACVGRVERLLAARPDVAQARVNLATRSADITLAAGAGAASVAQGLAEGGYPPAEGSVTLAVADMSCASCVGRI
jgi:Cu+-exporting ATPase